VTGNDPAPSRIRREPAERAVRWMLPGCGAVWTAAEIMHATHIPWLDITLGTTAAAAVGYGRVRHRAEGRKEKDQARARRHARHVASGIGLAGAWTALAARLGPVAGPDCAMTLAWAGGSLGGWLWLRRHEVVIAARDWRIAREDWHWTRRRWRLDRTFLLEREETRLGQKLILDVSDSGKLASQIAASDVAGWVAQDRRIPRHRVKVAVHHHEGQVSVDIREHDPWAKPILHPALDPAPEIDLSGPCTCREPFVIGQDPETGAPLTLPVWDEDGGKRILIVATSRAGKTVLLSCLRERATKARDVLIVNLNLSKALEDKEWAPACHLTALTRHQLGRAMKILRLLNAVIEWRSQQPRETAVFQPSPAHPLILFTADEVDALARYPAARELLRDIFSKGGSEGVASVVAGQRGTAEWIGGGDIRALVDVYAVGMVGRRAEAMHAAGDLGLEMPDMSRYGEGRKGVWAIAELGGEVRTGRTFRLKEPGDLRRLAEERAMTQPNLEPELQSFLGDSYVKLLSGEPFAAWARSQQGHPPAADHPRLDLPADQSPNGGYSADPMIALAQLARDGLIAAGNKEAAGTLMDALNIHEGEQASLDALDQDMEEHLGALDDSDPLRRQWIEQGRRNAETRRQLEESMAQPVPDISHDDLVAHAEARWRQLGEETVIPDDARGPLLRLLAAGTTISEAARELCVSKWTARTYLERLRVDGLAQITGKGRGARWVAAPPPGNTEEGDAP
jgi:hypothetical protein